LASEEPTERVAAVNRALNILAALAAVAEPLRLAQIAQATGLYKSTILRLMSSLAGAGYVMRLRDGRYGLGASAFRLGLAYERQNPVRRHVLPVLNDLVANGTESSSFHVIHDATTRLCLFRVNSSHSTLDRIEAGSLFPLDRGAAGRVLLAYSRPDDPTHEALRELGYAFSRGERDPSCCGLAAPVFGPTGEIAGAISLSGPGERFTEGAIAHMRRLLLKSSKQVTQLLGGAVPVRSAAPEGCPTEPVWADRQPV
jgi:DNA-binding IclR family transcriptional regulator